MADENKPSAAGSQTAQASPSSPSGGASSAPAQGALPLHSSLPPEYAGKSAEEIYSTLSDRYKDYDQIRERASRFDKVKEYGYEDPDQVKALRDWAAQIAQAAYNGKAITWDSKAGQYRAIDLPAAPDAPTQPEDPYAGWEMLDWRQQEQRRTEVIQKAVMAEVQKLAQQFQKQVTDYVSNNTARDNGFLKLIEQKLGDPDLDIKGTLDLAQKVKGMGLEEIIDWSAAQHRAPRDAKKAQDEAIGKAIAEARAKWEAENNANAAPIMDTPRTWQPRGMKDDGGKLLDKESENRALLRSFREKGWIRPN